MVERKKTGLAKARKGVRYFKLELLLSISYPNYSTLGSNVSLDIYLLYYRCHHLVSPTINITYFRKRPKGLDENQEQNRHKLERIRTE